MINYSPFKTSFHRFAKELLKDKYPKHAETIERIGSYFLTEKDIKDVSQMLIDCYEQGFLQCTNNYKDELTKLGIKVEIIPQNKAL